MIEDYKNILLKYLTGNLSKETGDPKPYIPANHVDLNNNVYDNINSTLTTEQSATAITILGKIYSEKYGSYLIYGYYKDSSNNYYGFIYLVDDELNEIQMITEFASGTKLFPLVALNLAEDDNIYGLSHTIGTTPGTMRVMLFNNIFSSGLLTGEYRAVLRNDYIIPYSYYPTWYRQNCITKSQDSATYYIVLQDTNSKTHIVKFVINVGSTNEWADSSINDIFQYRFDTKLDKSSGSEVFNLYAVSYLSEKYLEYSLSGTTITKNKEITLDSSPSVSPAASQVFSLGNNIYVSIAFSSLKETILYIVNGNQLEPITNIYWYSSGGNYYLSYYNMFSVNGGLFYIKEENQNTTREISLGYIEGNQMLEEIPIGTSQSSAIYQSNYSYVDYYYTGLYNLVNVYVPIYGATNITRRRTFDYNAINFNGDLYENVNSLVPVKARIYNTNDEMIFARNLYNKVIYGNTTLSQLQIPNTLLNGITLKWEQLVSATSRPLALNSLDIEKNIYETLYINYYNKLLIQNQNVEPYVSNLTASEILNNSVSNTTDYDNKKATKYRLTFNDNTTEVNSIAPTITDGVATYSMNIVSLYNNPTKTIEIISEDETTTYQTIDISNLTPGKIYNVVQECHIE